jgi:CBS domain-containing protein
MSDASCSIDKIRDEKIGEIVTELLEGSPQDSLHKMVSLLAEKNAHEVLIPQGRQCAMISLREILRCTSLETTKPSSLMVHVPVLTVEDTVAQAARIMTDYRIRTIPVLDKHKIIGQVTSETFLHLLKGKLGDLRISSLATQNLVTIGTNATAGAARDLMVRKRIDHLPVKNTSKLAGMITSDQIVALMFSRDRVGTKSMTPESKPNLDIDVKKIMDPDILTCPPQTVAEEALRWMLSTDKSCVLITQWEELQGITTQRNFMSLLTEPEENTELPIYIVGLPEDPFEAEVTKQKFKRSISQLNKILPEILEARSVIKSSASQPGRERRRYEVTVYVKTPKKSYSYAASGWQLPEVYDIITDRLKRLLSQKDRRRERDR